MAEKCEDFSNYGYPDERFETVLSENLHCAICSNVFKDPVMCKNEHCFCRACITEHLRNSQNCPCCNQHLSVESLADAPRILRNLLSELRIRCDYHQRGCEEFVQLGNLPSHIATCPKAPVACANDECSCEMNREDQARHESEECRFRKIKCRNCKEMDSMMQEIGANLGDLCEHVTKLNTSVNEKLSEMKIGLSAMENRFEKVEKGYEKVETNLEEMQSKFEKLENRFEEVENQCHESLHDMESTRSDQATQADLVGEDQIANNPTQNAYIVAGGYGRQAQPLNSVEIFDKSTNSWRQLQPMKKCRADASSVVYNGQLLVTGGVSDGRNILSSMEQFIRNPNPFAPPYWSYFPVNLPRGLRGHRSVVYNNRLLVIGGHDDESKKSYLIYEIQLQFPYNSKVLAEIPSYVKIAGCGVVLVDDKIFLFGGEITSHDELIAPASSGVTMYDITKNEFKKLEPLPHGMYHMPAVKQGASVILCGGFAPDYSWGMVSPKTVLRYNIETQKSDMLSRMSCIRSECSGIVDGNSVVVMGGRNPNTGTLNTVEAFEYSQWRNLPSMNEARRQFVAEIM